MQEFFTLIKTLVEAIETNPVYQLLSLVLTGLAIWSFRGTLHNAYLRLSVYSPRFGYDRSLNQALLQLFSPSHRKETESQGSEKICDECGASVFGVAKPFVEIVNMGMPGKVSVMHRECIEKTKRSILDFDAKTGRVRCAWLSKLWKLKGRPSHLETSTPPLAMIRMLDPRRNYVDFIACTFNRVQMLPPDTLADVRERLPRLPDGRPWNAYYMGMTPFFGIRCVVPNGVEPADVVPILSEQVHEIGHTFSFQRENRLARMIRSRMGHTYNGSTKKPLHQCRKCGRFHIQS